MSNPAGLILFIALAEAVLGVGVYVGLRVYHLRKYRITRAQLSGSRKLFAKEKTVRRLRLLAILDNLVARSDRLIDALSASTARNHRPALAGGKQRHRKHR